MGQPKKPKKRNRPKIELTPQKGPQTQFLASTADITIFGGSAGGGKTHGLLLDVARHHENGDFRGVIFRRDTTQIRNPGGLWDESNKLYRLMNGVGVETKLNWKFPSGAQIKFAHMEYEKDRFDWDGSQLAYIGFDQLEHFTSIQFWYMLSRLRNTAGVRGVIRETVNPDPDSFLRELLDWWIGKDGYAIPRRSGVIRWFHRENDELYWADTRAKLVRRFGKDCDPKSITYITSSIYDNKILLDLDPGYLSNLKALPMVERERLLQGNWNIRPAAGNFFKREWFDAIKAMPPIMSTVRFWDRAATVPTEKNKDPDWTVGLKLSMTYDETYIIENVVRFRHSPGKRDKLIKNTAKADGADVLIGLEQEPGASGKAEVHYLVTKLAGYSVQWVPPKGNKPTRAGPVSAQSEIGNISYRTATWNEAFFNVLEGFPDGRHDDDVDALSGAFNLMVDASAGGVTDSEYDAETDGGMRDEEF